MATILDLSENAPASLIGTDNPLSKYNRSNVGSPIGVLTPLFTAEIVLDTLSLQLFRAIGTTNTSWTPITVVN